jgi:hypothetical protein
MLGNNRNSRIQNLFDVELLSRVLGPAGAGTA